MVYHIVSLVVINVPSVLVTRGFSALDYLRHISQVRLHTLTKYMDIYIWINQLHNCLCFSVWINITFNAFSFISLIMLFINRHGMCYIFIPDIKK